MPSFIREAGHKSYRLAHLNVRGQTERSVFFSPFSPKLGSVSLAQVSLGSDGTGLILHLASPAIRSYFKSRFSTSHSVFRMACVNDVSFLTVG